MIDGHDLPDFGMCQVLQDARRMQGRLQVNFFGDARRQCSDFYKSIDFFEIYVTMIAGGSDMKKKCCIANAVLAFVAFCVMFGDVCYVWGESAANSKEMSGGIFLSVYYLILLIIAVILVHSFYFSAKPMIFAAVYSAALMVILWIIGLISWTRGDAFISDDGLAAVIFIVMTVLSLCISAVYLFAALKKEKGEAGEK